MGDGLLSTELIVDRPLSDVDRLLPAEPMVAKVLSPELVDYRVFNRATNPRAVILRRAWSRSNPVMSTSSSDSSESLDP
jgi:hypothetical protein